MEYRTWKKQNSAGESIRTSLLGYGCMRFPTTPEGAIDEPRAEALLNAARDAGVNYFDTAYPYHGGQSEPFVGRVIAKWPRESFYLATKMPLWQCGSLEEAQHIFEEQLRRLGVEYIDFYLLHSLHTARYDRAKEMGIVDWLWEQKKLGRIRSFGFSCHDNAAGLEHILRDQPWDFCQLQYNYLDTDDRAEEISGDRGYQLTEELNIPVICYGLRSDFSLKGFPGSTRLLELAHTIEEMKTICTCGRKATCNCRKVNGEFVFEGEQVAIDLQNDVQYVSMCPQCYFKAKRAFYAEKAASRVE